MRFERRPLDGVLLLDKPLGISSNVALQQARRLYRAEKAGHTGVLDPLATGLLPLCFGEATKFAQYLIDADKAYLATLHLGIATTTGDAEGEVVQHGNADISREAFQAACTCLTGAIRQTPPMYSALKHEGKPLYEYARKGITIERKAREVVVEHIDILEFSPPLASIAVRCSKGTYIRTLAEDIAAALGTVAHLAALRRTATAGFSVSDSHTLDALAAYSEAERDRLLLPCDVLVVHIPPLMLPEAAVYKLQCGQTVPFDAVADAVFRVYTENGGFVGLVQFQAASGCLKALRLMRTDRYR